MDETVVWDNTSFNLCDAYVHMEPEKVGSYWLVDKDECPKVVGEWTKVEDGLPEEDTKVWACGNVTCGDEKIVADCLFWHEKGVPAWMTESCEMTGVTHWMPYVEPEPPV